MLRNDVYQTRTVTFCVDKAHCVKKWYVIFFTYNIDSRVAATIHDAVVHAFLFCINILRGDKF